MFILYLVVVVLIVYTLSYVRQFSNVFFDIQCYNIEQHDIWNIFLISDILILVYHMQNNVTMMLLLFLQFFLVFFWGN